ncbi:MAG: hypothetical protein U5K75_09255 [Ahrensia sp.]|nr:hypothetical protein [Ahrensia sp.]
MSETFGLIDSDQKQKNRSRRAMPPFSSILQISLFWSLCCGIACLIMLVYFRGWILNGQTYQVATFYAAGAAMATYPAAYFARLITKRAGPSRYLIIMVLLCLSTLFFTACIFAFQYRLYFAQWHGAPFSKLWLLQQTWTAAGAVYTYIVLGLRLYFPIALVGLFVTSWWVNRLPD